MRYGVVEKRADAVWKLVSRVWVDEGRFVPVRELDERMGWGRVAVLRALAVLEVAGVVVCEPVSVHVRRWRLRVIHPEVVEDGKTTDARYTVDHQVEF